MCHKAVPFVLLGIVAVGMIFVVSSMQLTFGTANKRVVVTRQLAASLASAVSKYHADCGVWPTGVNGSDDLCDNIENKRNWNGPYVESKALFHDAWDSKMCLVAVKGKYYIVSAGEDMLFNTGDDIKVPVK
jgi:hypothetical protein